MRAMRLSPTGRRRRAHTHPLRLGLITPLNVGDKLRRYEKMDVTSYLVCDLTFDATKLYMRL